MNKNSRARRKEAAKNKNKGQRSSEFNIPKTAQGGSLQMRKQVIQVGNCGRVNHYPKVAANRNKTAFIQE